MPSDCTRLAGAAAAVLLQNACHFSFSPEREPMNSDKAAIKSVMSLHYRPALLSSMRRKIRKKPTKRDLLHENKMQNDIEGKIKQKNNSVFHL